MTRCPSIIPYAPIGRHGVVGDRRTAALVAADGTVDWLCVPRYDGPPLFGALLDAMRGGAWRLGPAILCMGAQRYVEGTPVLVTSWESARGALELTDLMLLPARADAADEHAAPRVLVRRLRCTRGAVDCAFELAPRPGFRAPEVFDAGLCAPLPAGARYRLWCSRAVRAEGGDARARWTLGRGEEVWAVLEAGRPDARPWTVERAATALEATTRGWREWSRRLRWEGPRGDRVLRSALTIHLLGYAPTGAVVAAPTTSLPERIGGQWNVDYRLCWVRDASLAWGSAARHGDLDAAREYLDFVVGLPSTRDAPLQVLYRIDGDPDAAQAEVDGLDGYRGSHPVHRGNRAYRQTQHDALGFLCDCVDTYLERGGAWRAEYWQLVERLADHVAARWDEPGNGIWELPLPQHHVSSKVMSWVALERACRIAERVGRRDAVSGWRRVMRTIQARVGELGWSSRLGAFRQRYEAHALDAAALLIPVFGFLPPDDPRVRATVERVAEELTVDGLVYRFRPEEAPGIQDPRPMGDFEGAFLPCTLWLATSWALLGEVAAAEQLLERVDALTGPLGLLPEAIDARDGVCLGNAPLLFSHVEYVRAAHAVGLARAGRGALETATRRRT